MWHALKAAMGDWLRHHDARLGAALAFYSVFSLGPLLLIVVGIAGFFFGTYAVTKALTDQFRGLLGEAGSQGVDAMLKGAGTRSGGGVTAIIGVGLLLVTAVGVVVQLKDAINIVWVVEEPKRSGWWQYIRTYVVSLVGVLGLGFLLAVSLIISTGLAAVSSWLGGGESLFWQILNFAVSFAVLTVLFALLFRYFPDAEVRWANAWLGGLVTSLLFNVGKLAISWYIGRQGLESTYGAAASLVVLLMWVYYSAQIVLFGAEVTHVLDTGSDLKTG